MTKIMSSTFCLTVILSLLSGCATIDGVSKLELSEFRTDIIIRPDNSILIENDVIDFRIFRDELNKRMITVQSRIVIHVHTDVSPKAFSAVRDKLKNDGFTFLEYKMYEDE